jgi:hypothetical protein
MLSNIGSIIKVENKRKMDLLHKRSVHHELLVKPVAQDNVTFGESRFVHAHNHSGVTMSVLVDVNGILPPADTVQCLDHGELIRRQSQLWRIKVSGMWPDSIISRGNGVN